MQEWHLLSGLQKTSWTSWWKRDTVPICNLYSENKTFRFQTEKARAEQEPDGLHGNKNTDLDYGIPAKVKQEKFSCLQVSGKFLEDERQWWCGRGQRRWTYDRRLEGLGWEKTEDHLGKGWKSQDLVLKAHWEKARIEVVSREEVRLEKDQGWGRQAENFAHCGTAATQAWNSLLFLNFTCCCKHRSVISCTDSDPRVQQVGVTHVCNSSERWNGCVSNNYSVIRMPIMC